MNPLNIATPQEIGERVAKLNSIYVAKENAKKLEEIRTESNDYIKALKTKIKEAKEEYLKPFSAIEEQALALIAPLEEATKDFSDRILVQKKALFMEKVQAEWEYLSSLDQNGEIAPFNEVYDPSWYGKPEKVWKPALLAAIKKYISKGNRLSVYFLLDNCTREEADLVEALLIKSKINYRKEEI